MGSTFVGSGRVIGSKDKEKSGAVTPQQLIRSLNPRRGKGSVAPGDSERVLIFYRGSLA